MDPDMKSDIDALSATLDAQVESYETQLQTPSSDMFDGVRGTISGLSDASGMRDLSEQIGTMLDAGAFSESSKELADTILPSFVGGVAEGFVGHWVVLIGVFFVLFIVRLIFISFVGRIDYRGMISFGNPGALWYFLIAFALFGLAGYYSYSIEQARDDPPRRTITTTYKSHFR